MSAKTMYELKDMLCKEMDEIVATGDISLSDLDTVHKITDTIKNIHKIEALEDGSYSYDGDWNASGTYGRGSYARRGGSYGDDRNYMADRMNDMMSRMSGEDRKVMRRAIDVLRR